MTSVSMCLIKVGNDGQGTKIQDTKAYCILNMVHKHTLSREVCGVGCVQNFKAEHSFKVGNIWALSTKGDMDANGGGGIREKLWKLRKCCTQGQLKLATA